MDWTAICVAERGTDQDHNPAIRGWHRLEVPKPLSPKRKNYICVYIKKQENYKRGARQLDGIDAMVTWLGRAENPRAPFVIDLI